MSDNTTPMGRDEIEYLNEQVSRLKSLREEKTSIADQEKEITKELRGRGHNMKAINDALKELADPAKVDEHRQLVDTYKEALED